MARVAVKFRRRAGVGDLVGVRIRVTVWFGVRFRVGVGIGVRFRVGDRVLVKLGLGLGLTLNLKDGNIVVISSEIGLL